MGDHASYPTDSPDAPRIVQQSTVNWVMIVAAWTNAGLLPMGPLGTIFMDI